MVGIAFLVTSLSYSYFCIVCIIIVCSRRNKHTTILLLDFTDINIKQREGGLLGQFLSRKVILVGNNAKCRIWINFNSILLHRPYISTSARLCCRHRSSLLHFEVVHRDLSQRPNRLCHHPLALTSGRRKYVNGLLKNEHRFCCCSSQNNLPSVNDWSRQIVPSCSVALLHKKEPRKLLNNWHCDSYTLCKK